MDRKTEVNCDKDLIDEIGKLLIDKKMTISTAESCTGGMVAAKLIEYPGISASFIEGFVTYSNDSKVKRIGVKRETLDEFGAVSFEVAKEMARGVANTTGSNIGVSTTGIAGPSGGSIEKPVGLVYIAVFYKGTTFVKELKLNGTRQEIRNSAALELLELLKITLMKNGEIK